MNTTDKIYHTVILSLYFLAASDIIPLVLRSERYALATIQLRYGLNWICSRADKKCQPIESIIAPEVLWTTGLTVTSMNHERDHATPIRGTGIDLVIDTLDTDKIIDELMIESLPVQVLDGTTGEILEVPGSPAHTRLLKRMTKITAG